MNAFEKILNSFLKKDLQIIIKNTIEKLAKIILVKEKSIASNENQTDGNIYENTKVEKI